MGDYATLTAALGKIIGIKKNQELNDKTKIVLDFESYNRRAQKVNDFITSSGLIGSTYNGVTFDKPIPKQPNAATFYKLISTDDKKLIRKDIPKLIKYERAIESFKKLGNIIGEIKIPIGDVNERIVIADNASLLTKSGKKTIEEIKADIYGGTYDASTNEVAPFEDINLNENVEVTKIDSPKQ
jgi:hypothetical protein